MSTKQIILALLLGIFILLIHSCDVIEDEKQIPIVTTTYVTSIKAKTAISGGSITTDWGLEVTMKGVCWDTKDEPTIFNQKTNDGIGNQSFSSEILELVPNTTYYLRAYATNSDGTGYGETLSFNTGSEITDLDGNIYNTVLVGTQIWLAENLKSTKFQNGNLITNDFSSWKYLSTPAYCDMFDEESYSEIYGRLYNWHAVSDSRNICPSGWHVPTKEEWLTLLEFIGGSDIAGGKLKEIGTKHWDNPNTGATNESSFSALPGGFKNDGTYSTFEYPGKYGDWWSSTESNSSTAWAIGLNFNDTEVRQYNLKKMFGLSVRCIKN